MLPDEMVDLWTKYLRAEQDRLRAVAMDRLAQFIDRLLREKADAWHTWALETAASVSDNGADIPVRFPLFERVLLPALADGAKRGTPGCARWLAHLDQALHQADLSLLAPALPHGRGPSRRGRSVGPGGSPRATATGRATCVVPRVHASRVADRRPVRQRRCNHLRVPRTPCSCWLNSVGTSLCWTRYGPAPRAHRQMHRTLQWISLIICDAGGWEASYEQFLEHGRGVGPRTRRWF